MAIAEITLDQEWLRRIRGKLSAGELTKACELADQDVRTWLRRLFGDIGRDEEFEVIVDGNSDPLNVAEEMIAEYEADPTLGDWPTLKELADAIAASFAMEWADFMSGMGDVEESEQFKATERMVKGRKRRMESVGYMRKNDGTVRRFQRLFEHKGMVTKKRSRA